MTFLLASEHSSDLKHYHSSKKLLPHFKTLFCICSKNVSFSDKFRSCQVIIFLDADEDD